MGTLKINGFIPFNQFWPSGKSDADTTKIVLAPHAFLYQGIPIWPFMRPMYSRMPVSKVKGIWRMSSSLKILRAHISMGDFKG